MKLVVLLCVSVVPLAAQRVHEFCNACHNEQVADFQTHPHFAKSMSCDACHGASTKHRTSTGAVPPDRIAAPDEVSALCGTCHIQPRKEYEASKHGKLVLARSKPRAASCTTCHGAHALRTEKQMGQQCQKCHASLSSSHPKVAASTLCHSCHAKHTLAASR